MNAQASTASRDGSSAAGSGGPCGKARPPRVWQHVLWIWMENQSYEQLIGNSSAPYQNTLARQCGLATQYQGVAHPSLPNYIAATSGGTWGIEDDGPPAEHVVSRQSIFAQLVGAGKTWRSYEESMPRNRDLDSSGAYAVKHNPAAYYTDSRRACARWDVPLGTTSSGPSSPTSATTGCPRSPSSRRTSATTCTHARSRPATPGWATGCRRSIVSSPDYRAGTTLLVITFDEGEGGTNRIATVIVSPSTPPGMTSAISFTHYSLLKTTEQVLQLPALAQARSGRRLLQTAGVRYSRPSPSSTLGIVLVDSKTELVIAVDIAKRLGMSPQRVYVLAEGPGFPRPLGRLGRSQVWRWSSVERWARETGRLTAAGVR